MSPDEFYDEARIWLTMLLRDNKKLSNACTFSEGQAFVESAALKMASIYRGTLTPEKAEGSEEGKR